MDILTHTLSGIAIATVVTSFSGKNFRNKLGVIAIAGFGAALPDFDAISLWSKFDLTIGKLVGLENSGKTIYFSKFWYSHHGFLHSFLAGLLIASTFILILSTIKSRKRKPLLVSLLDTIKSYKEYLISFILGFTIHLVEDMPTPGCVWGGVNFFWPSNSYLGGTGNIWWWNNYDIFLIVIAVIILNVLLQSTEKLFTFNTRKITTIVFILGLTFSVFQIKTREFDFNYKGHTPRYEEFEKKSKELQKQILGDKIYSLMNKFDNKIPLNF